MKHFGFNALYKLKLLTYLLAYLLPSFKESFLCHLIIIKGKIYCFWAERRWRQNSPKCIVVIQGHWDLLLEREHANIYDGSVHCLSVCVATYQCCLWKFHSSPITVHNSNVLNNTLERNSNVIPKICSTVCAWKCVCTHDCSSLLTRLFKCNRIPKYVFGPFIWLWLTYCSGETLMLVFILT